MKYISFTFSPYNDTLLAILSGIGFDSFQEEEESLIGYVEANKLSDQDIDYISTICVNQNISWHQEPVKNVNWNAIWESSFEPVYVDDFCIIKASFHDVKDDVPFIINIDPKMAFGTGHHNTTYMMIQAMSSLDFKDKHILDYGSGTGILSILAEKMGAIAIDAVDIEEEAYENIQENFVKNECQYITPLLGTIEKVNQQYDIILANINRNILLQTAQSIKERLKRDGDLLLSGILSSDFKLIESTYRELGFDVKGHYQKSNWVAIHLILTPR